MRPGALRDELVKTESISELAIAKAGATNINEALDKNPGIAVQVECSICNVRNVLLNNLPGRYTTMMIDGVPIFSSVSSAYGLDSVSVYGVERIDIARGAGASLLAPEALSGSVNIVTKRPTEAENRARAQVGSYGSVSYTHLVLVGVAAATAGQLRQQRADGGIGLAQGRLVAGAEAAARGGAFGRAELRHHHVIAFGDAIARLAGDAIVDAGTVRQACLLYTSRCV